MIRIVFDNGEIADCEHISKIYAEETEMDKLTIVGCILKEEEDVRISNRQSEAEERGTENETSNY